MVLRDWDLAPDEEPSRVGSKVALTLGYEYLEASSRVFHVFFRREGIFLRNSDNDTIAYSASLLGLGMAI